MYSSTHPPFHASIHPSIHPPSYPSVSQSVSQSTDRSIYQHIHSSVNQSSNPFFCLFIQSVLTIAHTWCVPPVKLHRIQRTMLFFISVVFHPIESSDVADVLYEASFVVDPFQPYLHPNPSHPPPLRETKPNQSSLVHVE